MNKYIILASSLVVYTFGIACINAQEPTNEQNRFEILYQKAKESGHNIKNTIEQKWSELKNKGNEVLDEVTGQTSDEIKNEMLAKIKETSSYKKALMPNANNDVSTRVSREAAWLLVKGYYLPIEAGIAYYKHCINGDKKFKILKHAVYAANQEINAEKAKSA